MYELFVLHKIKCTPDGITTYSSPVPNYWDSSGCLFPSSASVIRAAPIYLISIYTILPIAMATFARFKIRFVNCEQFGLEVWRPHFNEIGANKCPRVRPTEIGPPHISTALNAIATGAWRKEGGFPKQNYDIAL